VKHLKTSLLCALIAGCAGSLQAAKIYNGTNQEFAALIVATKMLNNVVTIMPAANKFSGYEKGTIRIFTIPALSYASIPFPSATGTPSIEYRLIVAPDAKTLEDKITNNSLTGGTKTTGTYKISKGIGTDEVFIGNYSSSAKSLMKAQFSEIKAAAYKTFKDMQAQNSLDFSRSKDSWPVSQEQTIIVNLISQGREQSVE